MSGSTGTAWLYDENDGPTGLMARAKRCLTDAKFKAPRNGTVLWSGMNNMKRSEDLVASRPAHFKNIQQLLRDHDDKLLSDLNAASWWRQEPIWWLLSAGLAESAEGEVWVFGSGRTLLGADQPTRSDSKGRQNWYADTVFEKVELPELENNPHVTKIWMMGRNIGDRPTKLPSGDRSLKLIL